MSLPLIAKHLEAHGRGEDTHLVHMTTGELKAMQKLAESRGGSLTINPSTGLPEAGFLSSVLPMALGAAAAMTGQEWAVPLAMALSAGGEYAMTGSLTKGLMAGIGAWGGAGLAGGLMDAGSAAAEDAITSGTNDAVSSSNAVVSTPGGGSMPQPTEMNNAVTSAEDSAGYGGENVNGVPNQVPGTSPYTPPSQFSQNLSNLGTGASSLSGWGSALSAHPGAAMAVAAPLLGSALTNRPTIPTATSSTGSNPFGLKTIPRDANGNPIFNASIPAQPNPHYQATYPNYVAQPYQAANGGLMAVPRYNGDYGSMVNEGEQMQEGLQSMSKRPALTELQQQLLEAGQQGSKNGVYQLTDAEYAKLSPTALMKAAHLKPAKGIEVGGLGQFETTPAAQLAAEQAAKQDIAQEASQPTSAQEGGLMALAVGGVTDGHLGSYSDGGRLLKGPGDGVSDGIPATIGGKQPARLADGEFVIPARIVSELGNGSTDAGAKRLYAMMDRIKHARAKAKDIAADTKAYKYLPAQDRLWAEHLQADFPLQQIQLETRCQIIPQQAECSMH